MTKPTHSHKTSVTILAAALLSLLAGSAADAKPWAHPRGWYVVDLPAGFELAKNEANTATFESKKAGWFMVSYVGNASGLDGLYELALKGITTPFPDASREAPLQQLTVNGRPARWSVYQAVFTFQGMKLPQVAFAGAVAFEKGGVFLNTSLSAEDRDRSEKPIKAAFFSLAAGERKLISPGPAVHWNHPNGWYSFDLPPGFECEKVDGNVASFNESEGAAALVVGHGPKGQTLDELFSGLMKNLTVAMPDASPEGPLQSPVVNGRPGRFGIYQGTLLAEGQRVPHVALVGAVTMETGGVTLLSLLNPSAREVLEKPITSAFLSFATGTGKPTTNGVTLPGAGSSENPPKGAQTPSAAIPAGQFENPAGSFGLPAGWRSVETPKTAFAKFSSPQGSTLIFFKMPMMAQTQNLAYETARGGLLGGMPSMKAVPGGSSKVQTARKGSAILERFQGTLLVDGRESEVGGLVVVAKGGKGYIYGIGIAVGPTPNGELDAMEGIVRTFR